MCQSAVPCGGGLLSSTIGCQRCPLAAAALLAVRPAVLKLPSPQGVRRPWYHLPVASAATPIKLLRTDSGLSPAATVLHPLGFVLSQLLVPAVTYASSSLRICGTRHPGEPLDWPTLSVSLNMASDGRAPQRPTAEPSGRSTSVQWLDQRALGGRNWS